MKHQFLPISIEKLHEAVLDCLIVEGVMLRDFGPWKLNSKQSLTFNFDEGTVTQYDDVGEIVKRVDMRLIA